MHGFDLGFDEVSRHIGLLAEKLLGRDTALMLIRQTEGGDIGK